MFQPAIHHLSKALVATLITLVVVAPSTGFAASTEYDGAWAVIIECGPKLTPGGLVREPYTDTRTWVLRNGALQEKVETQYSFTDWNIEVTNNQIEAIGKAIGKGNLGRWEHRFKGAFSSGSQLSMTGARYAQNIMQAECTLRATRTNPAQR